MKLSCIRQTELPHTTKLFGDVLYHPERARAFYPYLPLTSQSFAEAAAQIDFPIERRRALVEALQEQNAGNPLLERLAKPGTVAVVTGQQAGLLTGPAYTVYKALTAIRMAEDLCRQGIEAVPIFWVATEDHDFPEVNEAWLFDRERRPFRVEVKADGDAPVDVPVGGVRIGSVPLDEIRTGLEGLPFGAEAFALIEETYRPGETFGQAFGALLRRLLKGFSILLVDPMLPAFRALAAPMLRKAVENAPALNAELLERDRELEQAGYHAQVHVEKATSLVFLLEEGRRLALRRQNGDYLAGKRKISQEELADRAESLSPNALLRPVTQDWMMPTIAYVGGPAEVAYLAQSEVVYRKLLGRQPIAWARAGFTLLDSHSRKLMDRYDLEATDFFQGDEALRRKMSEKLVDPAMVASLAEARTTASAALDGMTAQMKRFDPSIVRAIEKSRRKIEYQFEKIARKASLEAVARDERAERDAQLLMNVAFPRHKPQERVYSMVGLAARHGLDVAAQVYGHVTLECRDHQIVTL